MKNFIDGSSIPKSALDLVEKLIPACTKVITGQVELCQQQQK
jgi:hypothetical protein